ncbi:MAG: hypothetical protein JWM28_765 [Chitinophagaceae bacterium]|nr:hypothetical protein [Chitinophagaceae bacterium]
MKWIFTISLVLFEVAGSAFAETIWQELDQINANFKCAQKNH